METYNNNFYKWIDEIKKLFYNTSNRKSKSIYIDAYWSDYICLYLPRLLFAAGLREKNDDYGIIFLTEKNKNETKEISDAFGAETINVCKIGYLFLSIVISLYWYCLNNDEKKIYQLELLGIPIGGYLADFIIRHQSDVFCIKRIRIKDLKFVIVFVWRMLSINSMFKMKSPKYYLVRETTYWHAAIIKLAEQYGAHVIQVIFKGRATPIGKEFGVKLDGCSLCNYELRKKMAQIDETKFDYERWAMQYYDDRRQGHVSGDAENAYRGKKHISKEEWMKSHGADINKKNIIIMTHCFSDDANSATSKAVYRDFYTWLIRTLEEIQNIDNVNWLLKAHPGRFVYNEGNYVYSIFEKYTSKENIFIVEDNISTDSLYEIIDGAVTVMGTCGLEFSSFGIPVVCAGFPAYGGFGFVKEPNNEREYIDYLRNFDTMGNLTSEQVETARKVSCAYFNLYKPIDDVDAILSKSFELDKNRSNDYLIDELLHRKINLRQCWFFEQGKNFEKENLYA